MRLTRESIATMFQIGLIILIFSYSFPMEKNKAAINGSDSVEAASADSLKGNLRLQKRNGKAGNTKVHFAGIKSSVQLDNQLNIQTGFLIEQNLPGSNALENGNILPNGKNPGVNYPSKKSPGTNDAIVLAKKNVVRF